MLYPNTEREPYVQEWINSLAIPALPDWQDPITEFQMIAERSETPIIPDQILHTWRQHLTASRRIVDQSEQQFIAQARRAGWSWGRVAEAFALSSPEEGERFSLELDERMHRTSPMINPQIWTSFDNE